MSESAVPDGYELIKDGTVRFVLDGQRMKLRRPKIGEYRKLQERLYDVQDAYAVATKDEGDARDRLAKARVGDVDGDQDDAIREARSALRSTLERVESLNLGWLREVFDMLSDKTLPPDDELPSWVLDSTVIAEVRGHWRKAPLARGVS